MRDYPVDEMTVGCAFGLLHKEQIELSTDGFI